MPTRALATGDGELDIHEFARAFRALGLPKRDGAKLDVDRKMFDSFDTNGNGKVSLKEIEENLTPKTRKKIEEKLDAGWKFDKPTWEASVARHARWNMEKVFMQFDADGTHPPHTRPSHTLLRPEARGGTGRHGEARGRQA